MTYIAQLEPESLSMNFLAHPPEGFVAERSPSGMPSFLADFDILTTADAALRERIVKLPGFRCWGRCLHWRTRFAGSTVTEYAPLPSKLSPEALADELLQCYGRECRLLIVKDLACESPLLDPYANAHMRAFTAALEHRGFVLLEGMQLAWVPIDFESTEEFLGRLSASRRKDIRRKLRARDRLQIEVLPTGADCFADDVLVAGLYAMYRSVYEQSQIHFDLLGEGFFRAVLRDGASGGLLFTYRAQGRLIGWNLCYEHANMLIDKYVGFAYPQAREHHLYFVSWIHNLEYAQQRGLSHYVAGWTDTEIKRYLGARLTPTRHAVYLRNPLMRSLLRRMARHFEGEAADTGIAVTRS